MKYAQIDPTNAGIQPVLGFFLVQDVNDPIGVPYAALPPAAALVAMTDAQWTARLAANWYDPTQTPPAFVAPPGPTLVQLQQLQIAALSAACQAEIAGGYVSSALGAPYTYPSTQTDQLNMTASVVASMLPGLASGWTTQFWCADAAGNWAMRAHTVAQIQQAGSDGKNFIAGRQTQLVTLVAAVQAAASAPAVALVVWTP